MGKRLYRIKSNVPFRGGCYATSFKYKSKFASLLDLHEDKRLSVVRHLYRHLTHPPTKGGTLLEIEFVSDRYRSNTVRFYPTYWCYSATDDIGGYEIGPHGRLQPSLIFDVRHVPMNVLFEWCEIKDNMSTLGDQEIDHIVQRILQIGTLCDAAVPLREGNPLMLLEIGVEIPIQILQALVELATREFAYNKNLWQQVLTLTLDRIERIGVLGLLS